ncbi:MAG: class I SAM-dependent methyltransferase [Chromatiales bacterium]|nr:class I SAM-dependent methyltransferase [Chromatiales bacterium]
MINHEFKCRACNSQNHKMILDMGELPLANAFVKEPTDQDDQFIWPLSLVMCQDCDLLQIKDEMPREKLFSNYLWVTSTSSSAKKHAEWLSEHLWVEFGVNSHHEKPFLVEIASNDGFFLEHYRDAGFDILGVDPSNLAEEADNRGLTSIRDFFGKKVARHIIETKRQPDVIVARNVLGHSSELQDLVEGMDELLPPDGVMILEMPYAFMLNYETQYDTIFHEHLSYLTVGSTSNLLARYGMKIVNAQFVDMNGGSILCEVRRTEHPTPENHHALLSLENLIHLNTPFGWRNFSANTHRQRDELVTMLQKLRADKLSVLAYGAAAKFMTMLNYCGIDTTLLGAVGDANPRKQGLLCPGVRIPVVAPSALMEMNPDYVLIGAWNFKDEIINYLRKEFGYAGKFIVPLPLPEIID